MSKQTMNDGRKYLDADLTKVKALENGAFEGIVASNSVDRHGEVIEIMGINTKTYMETNPIVLFGHDYSEAESIIGKAITLSKTKGGQLLSKFELFVDDNPKAALVAKLIKKGVCSLSIGFVPEEIEGNSYTKSEMVEFSVVPVPANGQAAITSRGLGLTKKELAVFEEFKEASVVKAKAIVKKGAVADEIAEEEMMEQKYANLRDFWDIVYAFCDIYYSDETDVADFGKLLAETVGLLSALTGGASAGDEGSDEVVEYSVSSALKAGVSAERIKEIAEFMEKKSLESNDDKTTTKSASDADESVMTQFMNDFKQVVDKMSSMHENLSSALSTDAGGSGDADDAEEAQSTGGNASGPKASNTVKEVATADKEENEEVVADEDENTEEETPVQKAIETISAIDVKDVDADTIRQLAASMKQKAVELEEDAEKLASSTTKGESSPTVRKRKLVLRQARKKVVTVDKMVELTLQQLNIK